VPELWTLGRITNDAMKTSPYRVFIVLMLLCQIGWFLIPDLNELTDSYRYKERWASFTNWATLKTTESKAAFDHERHLLGVHIRNRAIFLFGAFLIVDGLAIYYLWNRGQRTMSA
jgi:hypothetical protein